MCVVAVEFILLFVRCLCIQLRSRLLECGQQMGLSRLVAVFHLSSSSPRAVSREQSLLEPFISYIILIRNQDIHVNV